ncbi:SAM dependent carboxyl methyltransferase, partial [Tanacetum coccineum]
SDLIFSLVKETYAFHYVDIYWWQIKGRKPSLGALHQIVWTVKIVWKMIIFFDPHGPTVVTVRPPPKLGRSDADPSCNDSSCLWELFAKSLVDMAKEGLVKESEIKSFNVPTYTPYKDEVMDLIHKKGSFSLYLLESYEVNWDPYDTDYASVKVSDEPIHGKRVANILRAAAEPMLITYF